MNYGKAIRIVRAAKGLSQRDLARLTGYNSSYVSLLERGLRDPATSTLKKLARVLGIPVYLLTLLASDKGALQGISEAQANQLGLQMLEILLGAERDPGR